MYLVYANFNKQYFFLYHYFDIQCKVVSFNIIIVYDQVEDPKDSLGETYELNDIDTGIISLQLIDC